METILKANYPGLQRNLIKNGYLVINQDQSQTKNNNETKSLVKSQIPKQQLNKNTNKLQMLFDQKIEVRKQSMQQQFDQNNQSQENSISNEIIENQRNSLDAILKKKNNNFPELKSSFFYNAQNDQKRQEIFESFLSNQIKKNPFQNSTYVTNQQLKQQRKNVYKTKQKYQREIENRRLSNVSYANQNLLFQKEENSFNQANQTQNKNFQQTQLKHNKIQQLEETIEKQRNQNQELLLQFRKQLFNRCKKQNFPWDQSSIQSIETFMQKQLVNQTKQIFDEKSIHSKQKALPNNKIKNIMQIIEKQRKIDSQEDIPLLNNKFRGRKILPTIELISQINFDQPIIIHQQFYNEFQNNKNQIPKTERFTNRKSRMIIKKPNNQNLSYQQQQH